MKICIVGAGAIGGFIGTRLAAAAAADADADAGTRRADADRCEVSAVARGATLDALRRHGWRLRQAGELLSVPIAAAGTPAELGPQDLVVIAVKGQALTEVAQSLAPLLGPDTLVMPAMNGVPWWFGAGQAALGEAPLQSVDPGGCIGRAIAPERVIGCVVHASTQAPEPGLVEHRMGQGLIVGEPFGGSSGRVDRIAALLTGAGFDTTVSADVRRDIWYKLWGNMTINPVSAITGATTDLALDDPLVREFCSGAMREAALIGAQIGCAIAQHPDDRHAVTRRLGRFKSSMLQDVEAGRSIELDAIVGVVRELAQRLGLATPNIDALFGLARLFGRVHGLYPLAAPD